MRLKLTIAYDGRSFSGWQSQPNGNAIQDHLERALASIAGAPIRIHGAGRTDAGVHALGQIAHFDAPSKRMEPQSWLRALNAGLSPEIRILACQPAANDFHARFSAIEKIYRYRICCCSVLPPLEYGRAWHVPSPLDFALLAHAASLLEGTHDFASFAANRKKPDESTIRTLHKVRVKRRGSFIALEFSADGFLYRMVRMLTGSLVRVATGKSDLTWFRQLLKCPGQPKTTYTAPPDGLYLVRVVYYRRR
jgi:tRNA pseudouridine38-40 synthase